MGLPNLLATRRGRLIAFFCLYLTEGIPLGFAAVAVATQLRRQGVGPAAIGAFVGSFYLPWAFKWAIGPIVDVFAWDRVGRRRGWILLMQLLMALTLLASAAIPLPESLGLFTAVLLLHNFCGATQDVAIDALACGTLKDDERGIANGLMFAGAYLGQMVGGAGVLLLTSRMEFQTTFFLVAASIVAVTIFVVLPMREPAGPTRPRPTGNAIAAALGKVRNFAGLSFRSVLGSRGAFAGLFFAILPAGAMALGLALQSNLAVELGLTDDQVANLNVASTIVAAGFCVLGGWLSDRVGRRRLLFMGIVLTIVPTLAMAATLQHVGWIMPVDVGAPDRPAVAPIAVTMLWITSIGYAAISGAIYGVRSAVFMDVTNPAVAATQFTAYMALMNVAIAYSAAWQGISAEKIGYPRTLLVDAGVGMLCLALVPFLCKAHAAVGALTDRSSGTRARLLACGLAVALVAWVPVHLWSDPHNPWMAITETFFTLIFVGAAVFLAAGGAVRRGTTPIAARIGALTAPLLVIVAARQLLLPVLGTLPLLPPMVRFAVTGDAREAVAVAFASDNWPVFTLFQSLLRVMVVVVPLIGAVAVLLLGLRRWIEFEGPFDPDATANGATSEASQVSSVSPAAAAEGVGT